MDCSEKGVEILCLGWVDGQTEGFEEGFCIARLDGVAPITTVNI